MKAPTKREMTSLRAKQKAATNATEAWMRKVEAARILSVAIWNTKTPTRAATNRRHKADIAAKDAYDKAQKLNAQVRDYYDEIHGR